VPHKQKVFGPALILLPNQYNGKIQNNFSARFMKRLNEYLIEEMIDYFALLR